MDALEILKEDHRRVKMLFDQIKIETTKLARQRLFKNIEHDLELHSYIEKTLLYPVFKKYADLTSLVAKLANDHDEIKQMLTALSERIDESDTFKENIHQLSDKIDQYMDQEENELFPEIRKIARRQEREQLGRHILAARQEREAAA